MSAKKYLKMPAVRPGKDQKEIRLWNALKRHIINERARKKQALEAEVEEQRLKKEREAREKQDNDLREIPEQIKNLEEKLRVLRNEKQALFLKLKKVVNEDVNRKRQLKETTEIMFNNNQHMQQPQPHPQIFLPPRAPHQLIQKVGGQPIGISTNLKRTSSPIPISNNYYKQSSSQPQQSIYLPPKLELEGRRADNRAVLWNKTAAPYGTNGTLFYGTSQPDPNIYGQSYGNMPIRQPQSYTIGNKNSGPSYHVDSSQQKSGSITVEKINDNRYHEIERKNSAPGYHMDSLPIRGHIPMQTNNQGNQNQGYQNRPTQPQQNPAHNIFPNRFRC